MKRALILLSLLLVTLLLTGCMEMKVHVTINSDGSADLEYKLGFETNFLSLMDLQGENPLAETEDELRAKGYSISTYQEGRMKGIIAHRHLEKLTPADLAAFGEADLLGDGLVINRSFFRTSYRFEGEIQMADLPQDEFSQGLMANIILEFGITLPVRPSEHNATRTDNGGRSLYWDLAGGEVDTLFVEAWHWNILNLALTAGGMVLVLAIVLGMYLMNRDK